MTTRFEQSFATFGRKFEKYNKEMGKAYNEGDYKKASKILKRLESGTKSLESWTKTIQRKAKKAEKKLKKVI